MLDRNWVRLWPEQQCQGPHFLLKLDSLKFQVASPAVSTLQLVLRPAFSWLPQTPREGSMALPDPLALYVYRFPPYLIITLLQPQERHLCLGLGDRGSQWIFLFNGHYCAWSTVLHMVVKMKTSSTFS